MNEISDKELIKTIADFIEMGHMENIVAMFKADSDYYRLTGELIRDERFMVRMGMAVLFEELANERPDDLILAIPSLVEQLTANTPYVRGEAVNLLGIIGTQEAKNHLKILINDPNKQIVEIVKDILA